MERLGEGQIRLLSFSKTEGSQQPQLSRRTRTKLPDYDPETCETSRYIALSYCWGTERDIVRCDDDDVKVSTSLTQALPLLHRHYPDQLIWTDSLCIDQNDLVEKAEQVGMMSKIYQQAQRVVVWLGLDADDIYHALGQKDLLMSDTAERIRLLKRVATVPWFYRAWTFQEIRLGRNAVVMLGTQLMPWDEFIDTIRAVQRLEPRFSTVTIRSKPLSYQRFAWAEHDRFFAVLGELNLGITSDLAGLLFLTWYRECSEKRDKVYSVLGLTTMEQVHPDRLLTVDYQIAWRELCIKAARLCLNISRECEESLHPRLKILKISGMIERLKSLRTGHWDPNEVSQLLGHPSWAPDWWHPPQKTRSFQSLTYDNRGILDCLSFCCSEKPPLQDLEDASPFLTLTGILLGIINIDQGSMTTGGQPSIHVPPRCAGYGQEVLSRPKEPNSTASQIHIPKVYMSTFAEAVQRHFDGDCSCFPSLHGQLGRQFPSSFSQSGVSLVSNRFDSHWSFPVFTFPRPTEVSEEQFPAQVLSPSVESGDWLVLLEGGGMPFLLRPVKDSFNRPANASQYASFSHKSRPLPDDAGCFVLVGEASMCWDKLWPNQWDLYCRAGTFVII